MINLVFPDRSWKLRFSLPPITNSFHVEPIEPPLKDILLDTLCIAERLLLFSFGSYLSTAVSVPGHFQNFHPGFKFWYVCHVDRYDQLTLKQLRLSLVNEMRANSYKDPSLMQVIGESNNRLRLAANLQRFKM